MINVTSYSVRTRSDNSTFIVLELTGGLEMAQTRNGGWKAVVRRCTVPSNLDEQTAKLVIGTQMPGSIVRVQSDPYEFTDGQTGEVMTLSHRWAFQPESAVSPVTTPETEEVFV